jgi:hypothetical protein
MIQTTQGDGKIVATAGRSSVKAIIREALALAGYVLCLVCVCFLLAPFLPDLFKRLVLPAERWYPSLSAAYVPMPLTVFFVITPAIAWLVALARYGAATRKKGPRRPGRLLLIRGAAAGLIALLYFGSWSTIYRGRELLDLRAEKQVRHLAPGMPRIGAIAVILAADSAMARGDDVVRKNVLTALSSARQGREPEFGSITQNALFKPFTEPDSGRQAFRRQYNVSADFMVLYEVNLTCDRGGKLCTARYERREQDYDSGRFTCWYLMEIPAAPDRQYPFQQSCEQKGKGAGD